MFPASYVSSFNVMSCISRVAVVWKFQIRYCFWMFLEGSYLCEWRWIPEWNFRLCSICVEFAHPSCSSSPITRVSLFILKETKGKVIWTQIAVQHFHLVRSILFVAGGTMQYEALSIGAFGSSHGRTWKVRGGCWHSGPPSSNSIEMIKT